MIVIFLFFISGWLNAFWSASDAGAVAISLKSMTVDWEPPKMSAASTGLDFCTVSAVLDEVE